MSTLYFQYLIRQVFYCERNVCDVCVCVSMCSSHVKHVLCVTYYQKAYDMGLILLCIIAFSFILSPPNEFLTLTQAEIIKLANFILYSIIVFQCIEFRRMEEHDLEE